MRVKPGQPTPQMFPRGPKGPMTNPSGFDAVSNPRGPIDKNLTSVGGVRPTKRLPRAVNTGPRTSPPPTNVNPIRPGTRGAGAGTPQRQNTQSVMNAAMSGAGATPQRMQGLGAAMSGSKVGLGTGMGMNKMAGAGAALGKAFGAKKGGAVGTSKMGKVKTSSKMDGVATKGKTKGTMVKMTKRG